MNTEDRKVKQVIVFRKDLLKGEHAVRKGKIAAQCCHASLGALLKTFDKTPIYEPKNEEGDCELTATEYKVTFAPNSILDKWLNGIFTKVCVSVDSDEELVALHERITNERPDIPCALITDAGNTEFHGVPTHTCLGIGPFWSDEIDTFTKELKLF